MVVNEGSETISEHFFIPFTEEYLAIVLQWRNSERVRMNMHSNRPITQCEHKKWFSALSDDQNRESWIYCQHQRPVGILNFTDVKTEHIEWGCYLGETDILPGSGLILEWAALNWASRQEHCLTLDAQVLSFNTSALKLHKLFGYEKIKSEQGGTRLLEESDVEETYQVHFFSYATEMWKNNKLKVLTRMPRPIQKAIGQIQFLYKD
ncbi:MAG: UDP-4-amino-4,6-dideoxy-N-acetyl-beta-L-altrosamine N-acetyltransferase [Paraglaciecola sp.]|uniref:UDP-4-amino-4, 6-dideoxy-N-acetyl-beta-L-altrosamine N-acetyltransferase n=1 Tax=Paraglaciecola sp. TaxID=1920173 RepID=UPI0032981173